MEFEDVRPFLQRHHRGVITTHRANGAAHASIVVCGAYQGHAAFVIVRGNSVKARNLRRDPRCTVLAVAEDWQALSSAQRGGAGVRHARGHDHAVLDGRDDYIGQRQF